MKNIKINLQKKNIFKKNLPKKSDFLFWLKNISTLKKIKKLEVNILIVNIKKISFLNMKYCNKNYPTNILSFPVDKLHKFSSNFIGDLVICKKIIELEAKKQKKKLKYHWAHIFIHGILHLLHYDHVFKKKAIEMKNIEIIIMNNMGYKNPYSY